MHENQISIPSVKVSTKIIELWGNNERASPFKRIKNGSTYLHIWSYSFVDIGFHRDDDTSSSICLEQVDAVPFF